MDEHALPLGLQLNSYCLLVFQLCELHINSPLLDLVLTCAQPCTLSTYLTSMQSVVIFIFYCILVPSGYYIHMMTSLVRRTFIVCVI